MDQHNDDKPVGRVLSRREMLALLGGTSVALIAGSGFKGLPLNQVATAAATAAGTAEAMLNCVVRPALTEGPYFVDKQLERSDIRIDPSDNSVKPGVLLNLIFNVSDVRDNTCKPLQGMHVDVWHCDAVGVYSGVNDPGGRTTGPTWLRGYQVTDAKGAAKFVTIYPGWYSGRAVHIHFKIRTDPTAATGYDFTSQLFFDDAFTDKIYTQQPYAARGKRNVLNANDNIFRASNGLLTVNTVQEGNAVTATFGIGVDTSQVVSSSQNGGMPGGPGGPRGTPPAR